MNYSNYLQVPIIAITNLAFYKWQQHVHVSYINVHTLPASHNDLHVAQEDVTCDLLTTIKAENWMGQNLYNFRLLMFFSEKNCTNSNSGGDTVQAQVAFLLMKPILIRGDLVQGLCQS